MECDGYKQFMDSMDPQHDMRVTTENKHPLSNSNNINHNNNTNNNNTSPNSLNHSNSTNSIHMNGNWNSGTISPNAHTNSISHSLNYRNSLNSDSFASSSSSINTPPSSPRTKPVTLNIPEWSEHSIKLAKPCGKLLRKDVAAHMAKHCPFRLVSSCLVVYVFMFVWLYLFVSCTSPVFLLN